MWQKGMLGIRSLLQLVQTILYMIGISCALHGFESQFTFQYDSDGVRFLLYREDLGNKTNKGGLKHRKFVAKIVSVYPAEREDRCPVRIFEYYLSRLPVGRTCNALYLQPLVNYSEGRWYKDSAIGVNKLQKTVKSMWERAGLQGFFSNHSLRATSATHMYNAGNDEQVIQ